MKDVLICKPFNGVFFGFAAIFAVIFAVGVVILRKKEERTRAIVLSVAMVLTLVGFVVYKLFLSRDEDFSRITDAAGLGSFNWWGELPIQLCNINMILIPIAALTRKRPLMCFSFFLGPLGAFFALVLPSTGFESYSILLPRMLGFFGTHWMVLFGSLALGALGLYKPEYKDFIMTALTGLVLSFGIFLVNMLFRTTGLDPHANYFFAVEPEGNPILELFHSWIPYPFLYLIPCLLILTPYVLLVVSIVKGAGKLSARSEKERKGE